MNYQLELDKILEQPENHGKKLFLHSCCGPCSSYVIEYLSQYFQITVFYYNPNISFEEEYRRRVEEQKRLIASMPTRFPVDFQEGDYEPGLFFDNVRGLEKCREGEERCAVCFEMRLKKTAKEARRQGYDFFTTTLTISPLKNATILNEIGERQGILFDIPFLPSDFKKRGGYLRSIELSKQYQLYRQDYCGCVFSKKERDERRRTNEEDFGHVIGSGSEGI